jgi:shikimate dehydrogenase
VRLAVLGSPVSHSLSPVIHTAALGALGIDGTYEARDVDADGLAAAAGEIRGGTLDGANVTMPHKAAAAALCDRLIGAATRLGVVNTLAREDGDLVGSNTDAPGVSDAWVRRGLPPSAPVLVLGGGGAARAALVALEGRELAISTRRPGAGAGAAAAVAVACREVAWGEAVRGAVVVNATPLGMHGEALPEGLVDAATGLFEMAYGDAPTPAVEAAAALGIPAADGIDLLVAQAALSLHRWTGRVAPVQVMESAARSAVA